jgi:hypothetical protein
MLSGSTACVPDQSTEVFEFIFSPLPSNYLSKDGYEYLLEVVSRKA